MSEIEIDTIENSPAMQQIIAASEEASPVPQEAAPEAPEVPQEVAPAAEPEPPKTPSEARTIAIAARKERQLQRRIEELRTLEQPVKEYQQARALAKSNPMKALEMFGISLDDLTKAIMAPENQAPSEIEQVKQELQQIRAERLQQEQAQLRYQEDTLISQFKNEVKQVVEQGNYPLIQKNNHVGLVTDYVQRYAQETGKLLDYAEAANAIESELRDFVERNYGNITPVKQQGKVAGSSKANKETANTPMSTLTNDLLSDSGGHEDRELTDEERNQKALAMIKSMF